MIPTIQHSFAAHQALDELEIGIIDSIKVGIIVVTAELCCSRQAELLSQSYSEHCKSYQAHSAQNPGSNLHLRRTACLARCGRSSSSASASTPTRSCACAVRVARYVLLGDRDTAAVLAVCAVV